MVEGGLDGRFGDDIVYSNRHSLCLCPRDSQISAAIGPKHVIPSSLGDSTHSWNLEDIVSFQYRTQLPQSFSVWSGDAGTVWET